MGDDSIREILNEHPPPWHVGALYRDVKLRTIDIVDSRQNIVISTQNDEIVTLLIDMSHLLLTPAQRDAWEELKTEATSVMTVLSELALYAQGGPAEEGLLAVESLGSAIAKVIALAAVTPEEKV